MIKTIPEIAEIFIGLQEKPGNMGFLPHEGVEELISMPAEDFMETLGWQKTWAWCAFIPKAVWKLYYTQYDTPLAIELDGLFSPSVAVMEGNFEASGFPFKREPAKGAIAIWRKFEKGNETWQGHTGIVTGYSDTLITTIDGNTNVEGSREGIMCRKKSRGYNRDAKNGLRLKGFVHPIII